MTDSQWEEWFKQSWEAREEEIYRTLFGSLGPGIYPLDAQVFTAGFQQDSFDPRWLHHGVFECPPALKRVGWLYVTSGLSNAWEADSHDPGAWSGLGCELMFQCPEQSRWALLFMRRMLAFQILLSVGRFQGRGLLQFWDRIPLRAPIDGSSSRLTWAFVTPCQDFCEMYQLPSGRFQFLQFVGISEDEADFARRNGGQRLLDLLVKRRAAPVTDPCRQSVLPEAALQ